jgi:hypothetical protein
MSKREITTKEATNFAERFFGQSPHIVAAATESGVTRHGIDKSEEKAIERAEASLDRSLDRKNK